MINTIKTVIWPDEWTVRRVGFTLAVLAGLVAAVGYLNQHAGLYLSQLLSRLTADFYANVSAELASIAITVLIIDRLNQRRATQQEKADLILQMSSPSSAFAQEAVRRLRLRGWLKDGSLEGTDLRWANLRKGYLWSANLQGVDLDQADLTGAYLAKANLSGARNLSTGQLVQVRNLRRAILPDGSRYDGRFNLAGDFSLAGRDDVDTDDPVAMAGFYGVSLEKYQHGQEWARKNLPQLRSIARRDAGKLETKQIMVTGNTESPERPILVLGIVVFAITVACRFLQGRCREVTAA